jgi:hypothetical protein
LDALLDRSDAPAVIQKTRSEDLHYLVKHIGINDGQEIMLYAREEQIRDFLAIETFEGDRFVPERLQFYVDYIEAMSHDKAIRLLKELDPEAFALMINRHAVVKIIDEDHDPQDEEFPVMLSPDGVFMLVSRDEEGTGQAEVKRILNLLYETDIALGRRVLFMCVYDLPSNLEETLFRFREDYMEQMGFPHYNERLDIYAWVPALQMREMVRNTYAKKEKMNFPKSVAMQGITSGLVVYDAYTPSLFYDALVAIDDPAILRMVMTDFQYLVDGVMRARHKDLSVEDAWTDAAKTANAFVSVGLDFLTDGDREMATFVLETFYLKDVFRAGFSLFDRIAKRARSLVKTLGSADLLDLFDEVTAETVRGLLPFPPRLYEGLIDPQKQDLRDPITYGEVTAAARVVDRAKVVLNYMTARFGFKPDPSKDVPSGFQAVFNTAAIRSLLSGQPGITPLTADELTRFIDTFLKDPQVSEALKFFAAKEAEDFFGILDQSAELLREFAVQAISGLITDLKSIDTSSPVDPRFVGDRVLVNRPDL